MYLTKESEILEKFFEEKKGITIDAAFKHGARYTAVDMARFAKEFCQHKLKKDLMEDDWISILEALWSKGEKLKCVKLVKNLTDMGLKECKRYCEDNLQK